MQGQRAAPWTADCRDEGAIMADIGWLDLGKCCNLARNSMPYMLDDYWWLDVHEQNLSWNAWNSKVLRRCNRPQALCQLLCQTCDPVTCRQRPNGWNVVGKTCRQSSRGMGLAYDVLEQNNLTKPLTCNMIFLIRLGNIWKYYETLSH